MNKHLLIACLAVLCLGLCACDFGQVEQGRTVAFDKDQGLVTLVQDATHSATGPEYTGTLLTFKIPADPAEMGPTPQPGGFLAWLPDKKVLAIYNPDTRAIQEIPLESVDVGENVSPDDPQVQGKTFPLVDQQALTVTTYAPQQRTLTTYKVPADVINLPPDTWRAGDLVRVYYKEAGQALRLMNVTRTNIYKR